MKKSRDTTLIVNPDYQQFIEELKTRVISARVAAARAITHEAILLYWDIGRGIVEKQKLHAWGESVIEQVSMDLLNAFPGSTGYSPRNLRSARQLYLTYSNPSIWLQPVARLAKQPGASAIWLQPVAKLTPESTILNDKERGADDQPSIGIILCAEKDDVEVEYALRSKANPIGVATYQLQPNLPAELKGKLPTAKQLANIVRVEMGGVK